MASLLYETNGRVADRIPANGQHWTLPELQEIVGGYIQVVLTVDNKYMVINDNGKTMDPPLDPNFPATRIYKHGRQDWIAGPALVVDSKFELDGPDDEE